jgi:tRNA pseudouridine13 synthase
MQNYKIKQKPEDFIVKEIPNKVFSKNNGKYLIYKLKKRNRNTEDCIQFLCRTLKIKRKFIGYAGTKDKHAITEQFISVYNIQNLKNKIKKIDCLENFSLEFIGYSDNPISLGDLIGNKFEIIIRNLDKINITKITQTINYFDEQRFSEINAKVGKRIIQKKFKEATEILKENNTLKKEVFESFQNNYIKILRTIPKKILKLYVHAYQSYLFNETCCELFEERNHITKKIKYSLGEFHFPITEIKNEKIPIIGFGSEIKEKYEYVIKRIMNREKITTRDFIIKQIPELSAFGTERDIISKIENFQILEQKDDELNENKKKLKISFELQKGSYATIVVKNLFAK